MLVRRFFNILRFRHNNSGYAVSIYPTRGDKELQFAIFFLFIVLVSIATYYLTFEISTMVNSAVESFSASTLKNGVDTQNIPKQQDVNQVINEIIEVNLKQSDGKTIKYRIRSDTLKRGSK